MEIVNLVDFVKSWEIFDKIEWIYDQIISDFDFWNLEWFVKINNFLDFDNIDKSKKTLFILDKLLYENINQILDISQFCILDMNFWINSFGNKLSISNIDPDIFINKNIDIYEPCDLISLIGYLESKWKNYIRINTNDLPLNFSANGDVRDFIDLSNHWFEWDNLTLITSGSLLPEIIRTSHLLNENWLFVNVFVLNKINIDLSSLNINSKNIIFVLDFFDDNQYQKMIKNKLKWFNIKFIYPNYFNINTILYEYRYQNLWFDAESLFTRIKGID